MANKKHTIVILLFTGMLLLVHGKTYARTWTNNSAVDTAIYTYQGDTTRQHVIEYSVTNQLTHLDNLKITPGYKWTRLKDESINSYRQDQFSVDVDWFTFADYPGARLGWHLNAWRLTTPSSSIANIYSGGWSFLNYGKSFYFDVFFTQSNYVDSQNDDTNNPVMQGNLSIEFSPGFSSSWFSLQLFSVRDNNAALFVDPLYSAQIEWTQYFGRTGFLIPGEVILGVQLGVQRYLVNSRLNSVNNSPDSQAGGFWLSAVWHLNDHLQSGLSLVSSRYESDAMAHYESLLTSIFFKFKW